MSKISLYLSLFFILVLGILGVSFVFPQYLKIPFVPKVPFKLGLDLQGGVRLVYQADVSKVEPAQISEALAGLRDVIERRINFFGISEPLVQLAGVGQTNRLIVELAGTIEPEKAIELIGRTPYLEFRKERPKEEQDKILAKREELAKAQQEGKKIDEIENWALAFEDLFLPTELTGKYLKTARLDFGGPALQEPLVSLEFNEEGAKIFEKLTEENVGKRLAIYIDDQLISAPVVQEKISGGKAQITGKFTIQEARELARNLSAGALPLPIKLVSQEQVGPALGQLSLQKSVKAGVIGFMAIAIFIIIFYRLPGLLSVISLFLYAIFTLAIFKLFGVTLTLAGIGGFILSIGMAIDANILIMSRFKEEVRERQNILFSLSPAFLRAWPAIRDGNLTTMLVGLIMFGLGTSFVKGFALTLILGLVISIIVAMGIWRILFEIVASSKFLRSLWLWT